MIEACGWLVVVACLWLVWGRFGDCFVDIVYVTLDLEDQGCCCLILNNILGGSYVITC